MIKRAYSTRKERRRDAMRGVASVCIGVFLAALMVAALLAAVNAKVP